MMSKITTWMKKHTSLTAIVVVFVICIILAVFSVIDYWTAGRITGLCIIVVALAWVAVKTNKPKSGSK